MSSTAPTGSPPSPDQNSTPPGAEAPPTASPPPLEGPPPPAQKQNSPPPATPPPTSTPSSSSPPDSTSPPSPPPSPPSGSGSGSSAPPPAVNSSPPASPPPPHSGSSKSPPPSNGSSSHSPPPQGSPTSAVPPPSISPPPPASPNHSTPPTGSPPKSPAISSPPTNSSSAQAPPTPVATNVPPPPDSEASGSPTSQTTSPPPNAIPSPQTTGSPPSGSSTQNPTPSNVPPSTSTTPSSQTPPNVPKLSPPSSSHPSQSSPPSKSSDTSSGGPVIGITVAGVVIIAFFAFLFVARRRKKREEAFVAQFKSTPKKYSGQSEGYYYHSQQYTGGDSGQAEAYYGGKPMGSPHAPGNGYGNQIGYSPQAPEANVMGAKSWFSYEELMEITNGFSRQNILGEGGFGCVYKGWLPDGRVVAVKQLKAGSGQGEREFRAEVDIISRVHHRHLVSLVGYCIAEHHRLLVYEFVPNNTLEHHLHGKGLPVMEWSKRVKIAVGAARGLAYLHEDCHPKIIHRDIKSANILVDDVFEAQVADFGLAKLTNDTNTHVSTRVMGTFGYMAPEYASSGKLTDRSDVFSFGVVLLELVTGRKPIDPTQPYGDGSLVEWARPLLIRAVDSGDFEEIADPRLEKRYVESEMFRMIETAAACVRHSAQKRPRMSQVVRALDSECEMGDISNGVKFGQSAVFESGQYPSDIQKFRRMAFGSEDSSEYSTYSGENNSREVPRKSPGPWSQNGSSSEFSGSSKFFP